MVHHGLPPVWRRDAHGASRHSSTRKTAFFLRLFHATTLFNTENNILDGPGHSSYYDKVSNEVLFGNPSACHSDLKS
ncbi:hypothetical protein Y032_0194g1416 [Ancylostoma ceylanicum]|uniref:Uncharacterized protein n=1 Tax=Ancylostoma ceylanicum TaxID=53326 RepID=A0A016SP35_9BILA|nr:hypothetical protein Y032_0194g1416 [Ancylostoma ceylanicum]